MRAFSRVLDFITLFKYKLEITNLIVLLYYLHDTGRYYLHLVHNKISQTFIFDFLIS